AAGFRNVHAMPFMRTKTLLEDYLSGTFLLSQNRGFELRPGMVVVESTDVDALDAARRGLSDFIALNRFVSSGEHLLPGAVVATRPGPGTEATRDDSVFRALGLDQLAEPQAFDIARA